jgi:hypothetical protein
MHENDLKLHVAMPPDVPKYFKKIKMIQPGSFK